ncbi:MAG TPA: glycosyltransferase [Rhodopila sp.]|nr:glycosyltransferase [Rhodopila sp.]
MRIRTDTLRRVAAKAYLRGSGALTATLLGARSGPRSFHRVVVVSALSRNNGIAAGAQLQHAALSACGVDVELLDAAPSLRNPLFRIKHQPGSAYIFHAGGPQIPNLIASVLPAAAAAYRIGYWAWELPDPPRDWAGCDRHISEIWTPSTFSRDSLGKQSNRPIEVVPHFVRAEPARRRDWTLPFTVLALADSRSSWSRKNPAGAILAFRKAFGGSSHARLLLKLSGPASDVDLFIASIRHLLSNTNVEILRERLDANALRRLYRTADALLSLHRAEGYGLPMHEAMAQGVPVVATGWSGNLDYMSSNDSCLVPCKLVPVHDVSGVYSDSLWAEPDLDAAALYLRRLADDRAYYDRLSAGAYVRACSARPRFPVNLPANSGTPNAARVFA